MSAPRPSRCRGSRGWPGRRRSATASSAPPRCRRPRPGCPSRSDDEPSGKGRWSPARLVLLRHRGAPVAPMCTRAQIANPNPRAKRTSPTAARHGSVLRPWPRNAPKRNKRITRTTITALIRSSRDHHAAPLHRKRCHEPVQPEHRPSDGEDELDRSHRDSYSHVSVEARQGRSPFGEQTRAERERGGGVRERLPALAALEGAVGQAGAAHAAAAWVRSATADSRWDLRIGTMVAARWRRRTAGSPPTEKPSGPMRCSALCTN